MVDDTVDRMGPPPRSLAAEAYDCFMVRIPTGPPNARLRREPSRPQWQAPPRINRDPLSLEQPGARQHEARRPHLPRASRRARRRQGRFAPPSAVALRASLDRACARRSAQLPGRDEGMVRPAEQRDDHNAMTNLQNRPRLRSPPHSNHLTPKSPCKAQHEGRVFMASPSKINLILSLSKDEAAPMAGPGVLVSRPARAAARSSSAWRAPGRCRSR
jgi:hypothetical protein